MGASIGGGGKRGRRSRATCGTARHAGSAKLSAYIVFLDPIASDAPAHPTRPPAFATLSAETKPVVKPAVTTVGWSAHLRRREGGSASSPTAP